MRETGIDAGSLGIGALARAVRERAMLQGGPSTDGAVAEADADMIEAYWSLLNTSPDERQALIETLVVPETWFFRDREAFVALARLAGAQLVREPQRALRILSVPCSTGEEPYSISMALLDAGIDSTRFIIDAIDISARAIANARQAIYGRNSFRSAILEFRDRHFSEKPGRWLLGKRAREPVRFIQANMFDLPSETETRYDFVFCRNVLIYFDQAAQDRAIRLLDSHLTENGTLFVGPAETGLMMRHAMAPARIPLAFAFHRAPPQPANTIAARRTGAAATMHRAAMAPTIRQQPRPAPSLPTPSAPPRSFAGINPAKTSATRDRPPATLDGARRLADIGQLAEAERGAHRYTLEHGPHADAFFLLGLIADARGQADHAQDFYRKALYLDPDHYEALTHLAVLLDAAGDTAASKRMMNRAQRVLSKRAEAESDRLGPHGGAHDPRRT